MEGEKLKQSLSWIVAILEDHRIKFRITGGCAAKVYGSPRSVNDIDIDIFEKDFNRILPNVRPFRVWGPGIWNEDGKWKMPYIGLNYYGQEIDIGGADKTEISNKERTRWLKYPSDFSKNEEAVFLGIKVPVINRHDLVEYKRNLEGKHQRQDIEAILTSK